MSNFNIIDLIENESIDPETLDLKLQNVIQTSNNKILSLNQKKEQIDKILGSSEQDQGEHNFENKIQEILSKEQIEIYDKFRQIFLQTDPEYSQNQQQQQQIQQNFEKQILKKESGNQIQDAKNKNKIQNYLKKINNTLSSILSIKPEIFEDNKLIIQGYKQILGELMDLIENNQQLLLLFSNLNLQKKESDDQKQQIQNDDISNNQEDNIENTQNLDCHQSKQELELNFENYQIIFDQYFKFEKKVKQFQQYHKLILKSDTNQLSNDLDIILQNFKLQITNIFKKSFQQLIKINIITQSDSQNQNETGQNVQKDNLVYKNSYQLQNNIQKLNIDKNQYIEILILQKNLQQIYKEIEKFQIPDLQQNLISYIQQQLWQILQNQQLKFDESQLNQNFKNNNNNYHQNNFSYHIFPKKDILSDNRQGLNLFQIEQNESKIQIAKQILEIYSNSVIVYLKSLKFIQKLLEIKNEENIIKINGFFNEINKKMQQKLQEREIYSHTELQPFLKDMEKQLMEIFQEFTTFNDEKNQFQFAHFASNINSLLQENYFQESLLIFKNLIVTSLKSIKASEGEREDYDQFAQQTQTQLTSLVEKQLKLYESCKEKLEIQKINDLIINHFQLLFNMLDIFEEDLEQELKTHTHYNCILSILINALNQYTKVLDNIRTHSFSTEEENEKYVAIFENLMQYQLKYTEIMMGFIESQ